MESHEHDFQTAWFNSFQCWHICGRFEVDFDQMQTEAKHPTPMIQDPVRTCVPIVT